MATFQTRKPILSVRTALLVLVVALLVAAAPSLAQALRKNPQPIFSEREMLSNIWQQYKIEYFEPGTNRVLDKQRDNITTSEGVSYALLRSVWMNDKEGFDASLKWANDNLNRPNDSLFAWLFGERENGQYGIIAEKGGANSATDGDMDIAMALIFAYSRWGDQQYLIQAKSVVADLWDLAVVPVNGQNIFVANDLERNNLETVTVNPSYFAPYAYRLFAQINPQQDWLSVVDSSYDILERIEAGGLQGSVAGTLPPNWLLMDRQTGDLQVSLAQGQDANFGYDAMRIPWRIALDAQWNNEQRATKYLQAFNGLAEQYEREGKLPAVVSPQGVVVQSEESPALYANLLPAFAITKPETARRLYEEKLLSLYSPSLQGWKAPVSYYDDNWAWFGMAQYLNYTPNLATKE